MTKKEGMGPPATGRRVVGPVPTPPGGEAGEPGGGVVDVFNPEGIPQASGASAATTMLGENTSTAADPYVPQNISEVHRGFAPCSRTSDLGLERVTGQPTCKRPT